MPIRNSVIEGKTRACGPHALLGGRSAPTTHVVRQFDFRRQAIVALRRTGGERQWYDAGPNRQLVIVIRIDRTTGADLRGGLRQRQFENYGGGDFARQGLARFLPS